MRRSCLLLWIAGATACNRCGSSNPPPSSQPATFDALASARVVANEPSQDGALPDAAAPGPPGSVTLALSCESRAHCVQLGDNMMTGKGVLPPAQSATLVARTTSACSAGDTSQCEILGSLYLNGIGVAVDEKRALTIFEKACNAGESSACLDTGAMLATGAGGKQDLPRAKALLDKACQKGETVACSNARTIAPYLLDATTR